MDANEKQGRLFKLQAKAPNRPIDVSPNAYEDASEGLPLFDDSPPKLKAKKRQTNLFEKEKNGND